MKNLNKSFVLIVFTIIVSLSSAFIQAETTEKDLEPKDAPQILLPEFNQLVDNLTPVLNWTGVFSATYFKIEISHYEGTILVMDVQQSTYGIALNPQTSIQIEEGKLEYNTLYVWKVRASNEYGDGPWSEDYQFQTNYGLNLGTDNFVKSKNTKSETSIKNFKLLKNYPNPFNPTTKISFETPSASFVKITVYNILGREIATLVNGYQTAGMHTVEFNAGAYPSGIYFCRMEANGFVSINKMNLIK